MWSGASKASLIPQDVCIFCATQLQNVSAKRAIVPSRRLFASTSVARKPPTDAAAQKDGLGGSGGWAKWAPREKVFQSKAVEEVDLPTTDGFKPEEEFVRKSLRTQALKKLSIPRHSSEVVRTHLQDKAALSSGFPIRKIQSKQKAAVPSDNPEQSSRTPSRVGDASSQSSQQAGIETIFKQRPIECQDTDAVPTAINRSSGYFRPGWACIQCSTQNIDRLQNCKKCEAPRPLLTSWTCQQCSATNPSFMRCCPECRKWPEQSANLEAQHQVSNWQHLRRKIRPAEPKIGEGYPDARINDGEKPVHVDDQDQSSIQYFTEEQLKRLENSRSGQYVPLRGLQKSRGQFQESSTLSTVTPTSSETNELPKGRRSDPQPAEETSQFRIQKELGYSPPPPLKARDEERSIYKPLVSSTANSRSSDSLEFNTLNDSTSHKPSFSISRTLSEGNSQSGGRLSRAVDELRVARDKGRTSASQHFDGGLARRKERSRRSLSRSLDEDGGLDDDNLARKRAIRREKIQNRKERQRQNAAPTPIFLPEFISVSNLAGVLRIRTEDFVGKMQGLGFEGLTNDHVLDTETAGLIASEYNFEPIIDRGEDQDLKAQSLAEDKSGLPARPPVVTIMGHVDHGKTTLLDFLRKSSVAASEHGGITQHIGAFSVRMSGGRLVTFLDTPGHAAFLSMRQRGATVTDIVILVVAADDSVKPQTIEAIKHAQVAKVPMIVAVNKVDKEDANPDRVKQDVARYGVEIEDFGGDTQVVCVSGKTGQGMAELEDAAVALADILDMRAEVGGLAEGWVLEATTKRAGRVATVLVRRGTLRPGDVIVAGNSWARVRSLRNEAGVMVKSAGPGTPVEIDGWREQPAAGDEVLQVPDNDEQKAKSVIDYRLEVFQREQLAKDMTAVNEARRIEQGKREQLEKAKKLAESYPDAETEELENMSAKENVGPQVQEVFFVIKADVSGSVEAVTNAISALGNAEVRPHILRVGVGPISEFDVDHAAVAKGHVVNFNTVVDGPIQRMAEEKEVRILDQSIIYRLMDDVKKVLEDRLPPVLTKKVLGEAEVAQRFEINVKGRVMVPVAGCRVRNGEVGKRDRVRVMRDGEAVYDGTLSSLKNVKKDITEARKGMECGMGFEGWTDFQVGDQVQTYEEKSERRTL